MDRLGRILVDIRRGPHEVDDALRDYMESEARDLSGEELTRFMHICMGRVHGLIQSTDHQDRLAGVHAINQLIDAQVGQSTDAAKTKRLSQFLQEVFRADTDLTTLRLAAGTMGRLVKAGGPLTADVVDVEVRRAIIWLKEERSDHLRYAAALLLRQMAENAPAVFNVHVRSFIDVIWSGLRDGKQYVREASVDALRACLCLVEQRETRYRVQWYYRLFESTQRGLARNQSNEVVHGSMLALGELLRHTGEFMLARYREVVSTVLFYTKSSEKLIRRAVIQMLPRLAAFAPERFARMHLQPCTQYLLTVLKNPVESGSGFIALGDMATALAKANSAAGMEECLAAVAVQIKDTLAPATKGRSRSYSPEALNCAGVLAKALKGAWRPHAKELIEPMILTGLTDILVRALKETVEALPELLPAVQAELLDVLSMVLAQRTFARTSPLRRNALTVALAAGELHGSPLVRLSLETLGRFNFTPIPLLEFTRDHVLPWLDDPDTSVRKAATLAAAHILNRHVSEDNKRPTPNAVNARMAEMVVSRLLTAAVADVAVSVRRQVLRAFERTISLDPYLAQADSLRSLFVALNDEDVKVRALAIEVTGRLSGMNPAYVMPQLRRHLMQLLNDMDHSPDSRQREESAHLLGRLIHNAPQLVLPYVPPIEKALVTKLRTAVLSTQTTSVAGVVTKGLGVTGSGESGVVASVLLTVGELAQVAGPSLRPHIGDLLPLIIDAVQDPAVSHKRNVAIVTLGQVCESTGVVIAPYIDYPQLLPVLLRMLGEGAEPSVKRDLLRLLGILGALDPHRHKANQAKLKGEGKLEMEGVRPQRYGPGQALGAPHTMGAMLEEEGGDELLPAAGLVTSSEEYYPTIALNSLMRSLRDPALVSLHEPVVQALFTIFGALGLNSVPYLPKVMPVLLSAVKTSDDPLRLYLLKSLTELVSVLRQHVRKYLPDLLNLVHYYWHTEKLLPVLLMLVSEIAVSLREDVRSYLPELLPKFTKLFEDAERSGKFETVPQALRVLEALGPALEAHLQLLLPALVRLICPGGVNTPIEVRRKGLASMRRLLPRMQLAGYASSVLHPLIRVIDSSNEDLRRDALDTVCSLALALGPDLAIFSTTIQKVLMRRKMKHERFHRLMAKMQRASPPSISTMDDESTNGWLDEGDVPESDAAGGLSIMPDVTPRPVERLAVGEQNLKRAWESSQRSTVEDWFEWMRHFSVELLKESPSPALRATAPLAQVQPAMARELFAAGFVSCWSELEAGSQQALVRSLEAALASPSIPPEIVTTLLNLAEFMEHDEKALPLDARTLGALAEKCHAFAKALHYKELEFQDSPATAVEALISINNHLRQPEAAVGVLTVAQRTLNVDLKESWYEKLHRYDDALDAYDRKYMASASSPRCKVHIDAGLGRLRCLASLAEWGKLSSMAREEWSRVEPHVQRDMAPYAAEGAWNMGAWGEMEEYVTAIDGGGAPTSSATAVLRAVLCVHQKDYKLARASVSTARELLGTELAALVGESYDRAYGDMVRVQQLTELEEVIAYTLADTLYDAERAEMWRSLTREVWCSRLRGVQRNVDVWQALLSVRQLVLPIHDDIHTYLKFASLCRKTRRVRQSRRVLVQLLEYDPLAVRPGMPGFGGGSKQPGVMFSFLKHLWSTASGHSAAQQQQQALFRLRDLVHEVSACPPYVAAAVTLPPVVGPPGSSMVAMARETGGYRAPLEARAHLRMGLWTWQLHSLDEDVIDEILSNLRTASECAPNWAKSWHQWGLFNLQLMQHYNQARQPEDAQRHVAPAVVGFFRSVSLGQGDGNSHHGDNLQDILRILTLWFNHGAAPDVEAALLDGFNRVTIDTWLVVIPQMIARIHTKVRPVRQMIHTLLVKIGRHHPQALMYPILVACKSQSAQRRDAAMSVVEQVRIHSAALVEQAQLVSAELIRMAILWHEMWHEALEEASRLYFGESNVEGMLATLMPLHQMMEREGEGTTLKEISFQQAYGRELAEAAEWCEKYESSRKESDLHQAWDLYYHVFKKINKQLPSLTILELQYVAPALTRAQGLELAVPGTYLIGEPVVTISSFKSQLHVITSKQRPRRLTIHGSNGAEYMFLLKGHEDLRQDERVMQLFGLVNTMLANDRTTADRNLSIARYAVIPLSPNSGLIGWVPNTDTLHALIREYREARKIPLNVEHRLMMGMAPDHDHLTVLQKVEVFEHALDSTTGEDLHKVLWLKSLSSEVWLERRTAYTRSTGVMSVVGYLLGLGDRHPSNLMLDRYSGKLLHIDFGDCFEASMTREKFPEKVPFRLTRMMIKAMEVSGIEGNFRSSCEETMRVLRANKESVIAMLEAFVHDPLINWRLLNTAEAPEVIMDTEPPYLLDGTGQAGRMVHGGLDQDVMPSPPRREAREREMLNAYNDLGAAKEVLNEKAVEVMQRMSNKLTGRDFAPEGTQPADVETLSVNTQVQRLIDAAMLPENLSASYIGWCPFW